MTNFCRGTGGFYQRQTAGCNIKYRTEDTLSFVMSFLYGANDKILSSIKVRLFYTTMIRLFTHYRKSEHFKEVSVYFKKSYFLFVCESCTSDILYCVLARAG